MRVGWRPKTRWRRSRNRTNPVREVHYRRYRESWRSAWGRSNARAAWLKPIMAKLDDSIWTAVFRDLGKIPLGRHRWRHAVLAGFKVLPRAVWSLVRNKVH